MKISLRAGEKIYINGAVVSVDRRVSLHLLNDVTFLLESHVMQAADAVGPLRQTYFAIQTMLIDPGVADAMRPSVVRMVEALIGLASVADRRTALRKVSQLLQEGRSFDALRVVREQFRLDEADRGAGSGIEEHAETCN